jgi:glycosyltransferase involved in cell wall biosynthesis
MRVLIDAVLGPAHPRGIGRYVSEIARHGARTDGARFTVAISPWHRDYFGPLTADGVEIEEVRLSARLGLRNAWHAYGLGRLARSIKADVVHVPDRQPVLSTAGLPMVATIHDTAEIDVPGTFGFMQRRYRRWVLFQQLRRATVIVTPSRFSAGRIAAIAPTAAVRTIVVAHGPGLDPASAERQPAGVTGARFVLFVGAVQRHKSVPLLIRAFRGLDLGDAQLVIAGAVHNDEDAVSAAAQADPRIVRLPDVDDAELAWLYRRAAVLAVPSRYEGFCIPLIEAMQFGCPVVAADAGAMPEIAGDAALVVPVGDEPALATALARVLSDADLRGSLVDAGRARAAQFSWERAAIETIAAYREAAAASRR